MKLAILDKTTPAGKAFRTALQAAIGITSFIVGLASIPGLYETLSQHPALAGGTLATTIALVTYLHNALEKLWDWLNEPLE